jgi:hypothetical protein
MAQALAVLAFVITGIFGLIFIGVLFSTVFGGVIGWIIGWIFPFVIESLNTITGLSLTGFETGAVLGFVGSFFRSHLKESEKKK